jgi:formylglycine-generating enzyme
MFSVVAPKTWSSRRPENKNFISKRRFPPLTSNVVGKRAVLGAISMNTESLKAAFAATPYQLLKKHGEGGYGEVWAAQKRPTEEDPGLNYPSRVAIKILKNSSAVLGPELDHDHIIRILDTGEVLGRPYQVMEFFNGQNLRSQIKEVACHVLSVRRIIFPLLDAIEHAHQRGIVHRDIKPENILVQQNNSRWQVKLTDFGLARELPKELIQSATFATGQGQAAGTMAYLAPELLQNPTAFSLQSDLYSFGVLLFELLTGSRPAGLELPSELNPKLTKKFDAVVKSLLASKPDKRPRSITEVRKNLWPLFAINDQPGAPIIMNSSPPGHRSGEKKGPPPSDELDMVLIPAGTFVQGHDDDPFARPRRLTTLSDFWIDRYPVTNEAYLEFIRATGHKPPQSWQVDSGNWHKLTSFRLSEAQASVPVVGVTYNDALAYATWTGKALPTEAQWERAAQGPRGWPYPYGEAFSASVIHASPKSLSSVDKHYHGRSLEGVFDLTGNAWEWCLDWYHRKSYLESDVKDPTGPEAGDAKVIRGGYDAELKGSGSAFFRSFMRPEMTHDYVGFRCAKMA